MLGKSVTDLQENVTVSGGVIGGNLHYVTGYTGFSGDPDLQEGNYLAVHFADDEADSISVRKIGTADDPVALDADGLLVMRVGDDAEGIEVHSTIDGMTYVNSFFFDGLTKEPPENE